LSVVNSDLPAGLEFIVRLSILPVSALIRHLKGWRHTTKASRVIGYDVTPDGKGFLVNAAADENTRPLMLVVNWTAELKKK
jgi:hypothetical protein